MATIAMVHVDGRAAFAFDRFNAEMDASGHALPVENAIFGELLFL